MPLSEDLSVFFDDDEHGTSVTYTPTGYTHPSSRTKTITVIFDRGYVETADIEGDAPVATCKAADVPDLAQGDKFTINSVVYKVVEVQPDGTGVTRAVLQLSA